METKRYLISDASRLLRVESHVLRYWEEELGLEVPRNDMGHRYYTEEYIELLEKVKALKEKGYQLKAIKGLLPDLMAGKNVDETALMAVQPDERQIQMADKMEQFQLLIGRAVARALEDMSIDMGREISDVVSERTVREVRDYFHTERVLSEAALTMTDENTQEGVSDNLTSGKTKGKKKRKSKFFRKNKFPANF